MGSTTSLLVPRMNSSRGTLTLLSKTTRILGLVPDSTSGPEIWTNSDVGAEARELVEELGGLARLEDEVLSLV